MRSLWAVVAAAGLALSACTTTDELEKNAEKEEKKLEKELAPYTKACKAEIEKICKIDKKELKKLVDCLKANKDKLGVDCRNVVEAKAKKA